MLSEVQSLLPDNKNFDKNFTWKKVIDTQALLEATTKHNIEVCNFLLLLHFKRDSRLLLRKNIDKLSNLSKWPIYIQIVKSDLFAEDIISIILILYYNLHPFLPFFNEIEKQLFIQLTINKVFSVLDKRMCLSSPL